MVRVALGVDAGTQSLKVLVVAIDPSSSSSPPPPSADGVVLARASASLSLLPGGPPGRAEQHPAAWVDALARALADAFSQVAPGVDANVVAVGVSGQQHGLVALDSAGNVIRESEKRKTFHRVARCVGGWLQLGYVSLIIRHGVQGATFE